MFSASDFILFASQQRLRAGLLIASQELGAQLSRRNSDGYLCADL